MTLLVRDEVDIVKANIEFHLDHGVDFIIATDNGSIDGTETILEEYRKKGVLHLIKEDDQSFSQSKWVNRMGLIAFEQYQADIIYHCDADEFWWPKSGSLKNELSVRFNADVLSVGVNNMILCRSGFRDSFSENIFHAVTNPLPSANQGVDSMETSLYLFRQPGKVMYKTDKGYLGVGQGNHDIVEADNAVRQRTSHDIQIIHYPLRSYRQFQCKVINGGSAYKRHPTKVGGWQWRRWYESYKRGELYKDYCVLTLDDEGCRKYSDSGVISDWSSRHRKICSYL